MTPNDLPLAPRRAFDTAQAAAYCALSRITLAKLRVLGGGPLFRKVTASKVIYLQHDLDAWLDARPAHRSTADTKTAA